MKTNIYFNATNEMSRKDWTILRPESKEIRDEIASRHANFNEDKKSSANKDAEYNNLTQDINSLLKVLKERECSVIKKRFGLCDEQRQTLEEIGNLYGVTKECIRQTEARALKKLKESNISEVLYASYVG